MSRHAITPTDRGESLSDLARQIEAAQVEAERGMAIVVACVVSLAVVTFGLGIAAGWW